MEARAARRDDKRAREDSPEMVKLIGGGDVMGGDDSFAAAKARRAQLPGLSRYKASTLLLLIYDTAQQFSILAPPSPHVVPSRLLNYVPSYGPSNWQLILDQHACHA